MSSSPMHFYLNPGRNKLSIQADNCSDGFPHGGKPSCDS